MAGLRHRRGGRHLLVKVMGEMIRTPLIKPHEVHEVQSAPGGRMEGQVYPRAIRRCELPTLPDAGPSTCYGGGSTWLGFRNLGLCSQAGCLVQ